MSDDEGSTTWRWHDENAKESIVIPQTYAVAVYSNPDGDIVIRQAGYPDDDQLVIVPRTQAELLAGAIKSELEKPF